MLPEKEITSPVLEDILFLQKNIDVELGLKCTAPTAEIESKEYGAHTFKIADKNVIYRLAKITPTKVGQFVTVWKRLGKGPIQPYDYTDEIDYFIIQVIKEDQKGLFIFSKSVLVAKGIITGNNKEGKRGIRVYPPWDVTESGQARKTQQWQLAYFLDITAGIADLQRAKQLLNP